MKINKIWKAYFSPTKGTANLVSLVADGLKEELGLPVETIDITLPQGRETVRRFTEEDLLVIGTPVYAGRIPNKLLPEFQRLFQGDGTPAVIVTAFGNRNFDDALMELKLVLEENGFAVAAAAALPNRHVFSDKLAAGRPDETDREEIRDFAKSAAEKLQKGAPYAAPDVEGRNPVGPYYTPLKEDGTPAKFLKAKPVTDPDKCDQCGICAESCPMGSINREDCTKVDGICIKCQACVKFCPTHARYFTDEQFLSHVKMLEKNYMRRAENRFFV